MNDWRIRCQKQVHEPLHQKMSFNGKTLCPRSQASVGDGTNTRRGSCKTLATSTVTYTHKWRFESQKWSRMSANIMKINSKMHTQKRDKNGLLCFYLIYYVLFFNFQHCT